jgi:hypothetical protein
MKKALILVMLCAFLFSGCAMHDEFISFPATRGVLEGYSGTAMTIKSEGDLYVFMALCGLIVGFDLVVGFYTFPHDFILLMDRLPALTSRRKSYDELPWHMKQKLAEE